MDLLERLVVANKNFISEIDFSAIKAMEIDELESLKFCRLSKIDIVQKNFQLKRHFLIQMGYGFTLYYLSAMESLMSLSFTKTIVPY